MDYRDTRAYILDPGIQEFLSTTVYVAQPSNIFSTAHKGTHQALEASIALILENW